MSEDSNQQELFTTLLPCIACGGVAKIEPVRMGRNMYKVSCTQCGKCSGYSYVDRSKAAGLWNMQKQPSS